MSLGFAKETVRKGLAAHTALGLVCFIVHKQFIKDAQARLELVGAYVGWFLLGTYLIYPSVSTTLFQTMLPQRSPDGPWTASN